MPSALVRPIACCAALVCLTPIGARAQTADDPAARSLLNRALNCALQPHELRSLLPTLRQRLPDFRRAQASLSLPAADLFALHRPATAFGYQASQVLLTPGRVLLVMPARKLAQIQHALQLTAAPDSPAARPLRPGVRVLAYQRSAAELNDKVLIGCEYAFPDAALWPETRAERELFGALTPPRPGV